MTENDRVFEINNTAFVNLKEQICLLTNNLVRASLILNDAQTHLRRINAYMSFPNVKERDLSAHERLPKEKET